MCSLHEVYEIDVLWEGDVTVQSYWTDVDEIWFYGLLQKLSDLIFVHMNSM
jgi:hypothetical protein